MRISTYTVKLTSFKERIFTKLRQADRFLSGHEKIIFWCLGILYKISLDIAYALAVNPNAGSIIRPYHPILIKYLISFFLYIVLFAALPKREKDSVAIAVHIQFAYTVAPMLTLYAFANGSTRYILMVSFCILLESFLIFRPLRTLEPVRIKGIQSYATAALGILLLFTLAIPILYNGFAGLKAFNLSYIYEMRANATYPPGFQYLLSWMPKAIVPFAFLMFLHLKKYRWALAAAGVQVFFYMETGEKINLLLLVPIVFVYLCSKSGHCLKLVYLGLSLLSLFLFFAYQLDGEPGPDAPQLERLSYLLVRIAGMRALFIPAAIKFQYYECFSTWPKLFFSDGQIGNMLGLTYPYKLASGFVVHAFQYSAAEFGVSQANTGYLGESYAQLGFAGMVLMSVLLSLILRSLRAYDQKGHFALLTALISIYMIILNDTSLLTTLFTGGMLVTYLLIFIYFNDFSKGADNGVQRL